MKDRTELARADVAALLESSYRRLREVNADLRFFAYYSRRLTESELHHLQKAADAVRNALAETADARRRLSPFGGGGK